MRVIGIDPGTLHVGYGIIETHGSTPVRLDGGTIHCTGECLTERLVGIHRGLQVVMREWKPDAAAVETVFFGKNIRTAIRIGEGRGVALLSAGEAEVPVFEYEPALVKRVVCGNGRAGKDQVMRMVAALLALPEPPATDHEADALAMAICHLTRLRAGAAPRRKSPRARKGLPDNILAAMERTRHRS